MVISSFPNRFFWGTVSRMILFT